jgi:hypothetical protein
MFNKENTQREREREERERVERERELSELRRGPNLRGTETGW